VDAVDAEVLQQNRRATDVDERVDAAELVKVDIIDGNAVYGRLGLGQAVEDCKGTRQRTCLEACLLDQRAHGAPGSRRRVRRRLDPDVERGDPVPLRPLDGDLDRAEAQLPGERLQPGLVGTGVKQRREQHVARDPADAVEVRNPAQSRHQLGTERVRSVRNRAIGWRREEGGVLPTRVGLWVRSGEP
jgi:hypothetical protein